MFFSSPSRPHSISASKRGFALLITVTLLAFLVLLLVSLATLTRVETQVAGNSQQVSQARQNALLALNIALGQLQKYAGPDQRVTATADLAGSNSGGRVANNTAISTTVGGTKYWDTGATQTANGLTKVQAGTRYWTGVWGNSLSSTPTAGNNNIYETTPRPVLLNWLVSGNSNATFTAAASGQITPGTAPARTPADTVSTLTSLTTTAAVQTAIDAASIKVNGADAMILVGPNTTPPLTATNTTNARSIENTINLSTGAVTAGSTENFQDRYVVAPLETINAPAGLVPGTDPAGPAPMIGRFAWWVGDEGVKARVNLSDDYASSHTDPKTDALARYRLLSSQRAGTEIIIDRAGASNMVDFGTVPATYQNRSQPATVSSPTFSTVLKLPQFSFVDATNMTAASVGRHVHDFTIASMGLETDSYNGGLRKDLTYYLEQNKTTPAAAWNAGWKSSWNPASVTNDAGTGQGILPSAYSPVMGALTGDQRIPKWDIIRSFYTLPSKSGNTLTSSAGDTVTVQAASATQVGIAPMIVQMRIMLGGAGNKTAAPVTVGTNPALAATSFRLLMNTLVVLANPYTSKLSAPAGIDFTLKNDSRIKNPDNIIKFDDGLSRSHTKWPFNDLATGAGTTTLHIPAFILDPGESAAFFVQGAQQVANSTINLVRLNLASGAVPNSGGTLTDYIYRDYGGWTVDSNFISWETGGNSSFLVEFTLPGSSQILQQLGGLNIDRTTSDYPSSENTSSAPQGTPLATWVYQLRYNTPSESYPSMSGASMTLGEANSSLRVLADFNPRAGYYRQTNYANFSGPYCEAFMSGGNTSAKLTAFSSDLVTVYWGRSTVSASGTVQKSILFDIPRWDGAAAKPELELPLISLGALQHVNLTAEDMPSTAQASPWVAQGVGGFNAFTAEFGSTSGGYATVNALSTPLPPNPGHQPAYAFANSYAPIFTARNQTVAARTDTWQSRILNNSETPVTATRKYYDISYLLNTALWDGYFFSSIPQSSATFTPQNPRLIQRMDIAGLTAAAVRNGEKAATYTLVNGAFNINSTSVDAWTAVLGGMKNLPKIPGLNTTGSNTSAVFPRTIRQTTAAGSPVTMTGDDSYTGYRQLSDNEIRVLATAIVKQVRMRGPFVSLSQFVNRVLVSATDATEIQAGFGLGQMGAIQKAIDSATLNDGPSGFTAADKALVPTGDDGTAVSEANGRGANSIYADTSSAAIPTQLQRSTSIPGWLTQADVLQAIGPVITARSDTFVIRTYGDVQNPATTATTARAWCEAVVQRMPDYVDSAANSAEVAPVSASATNQTFGRRFKVVSFRWLSPNDL